MNRLDHLSILSDSEGRAEFIGRQLTGVLEPQSVTLRDLSYTRPARYSIVDIDLEGCLDLLNLKHWLKLRPQTGKTVFAVDPGVRWQFVQACALGATNFVERPFARKTLLRALYGDFGSLMGEPTASKDGSDGVLAGIVALQSIFATIASGIPADLNLVYAAGDNVVANIESEGLKRWIDIVRQHHSLTYQHCLLVTGIAVAFGQHLGFSRGDRQQLALAGLFHDVGKAGVPVDLLEKPGPLEGEEIAVMKQHPVLGFEALREVRGFHPDILNVVLHHHEYLDGSGYPYGLDASQLSDLVRMVTIADVCGALLERRAYKAPLSCDAACQVLENMGRKLDTDLVREFRPFARLQIG